MITINVSIKHSEAFVIVRIAVGQLTFAFGVYRSLRKLLNF